MTRSGERGGVIGAVLLVIGLICLVAIAALVNLGLRVAGDINVERSRTKNGESVRVSTPVGSLSVKSHRSLDLKKLGIPLYPGAQPVRDNKGATIEFETDSQVEQVTMLAGVYRTPDSVTAVRDFYRKEMPHWILTRNGIEYTEDGYKRIISITRKHGETYIVVASIGEAAAN